MRSIGNIITHPMAMRVIFPKTDRIVRKEKARTANLIEEEKNMWRRWKGWM
jgi:hypothetical protein